MNFVNKIKAAYEPWNKSDLSEYEKKFWDNPKNREEYTRTQKVRNELLDTHEKTFDLVNAVQSYLSDLDVCPEDNEMVQANKKFVEQILKQASELEKVHHRDRDLIWNIRSVSKKS